MILVEFPLSKAKGELAELNARHKELTFDEKREEAYLLGATAALRWMTEPALSPMQLLAALRSKWRV